MFIIVCNGVKFFVLVSINVYCFFAKIKFLIRKIVSKITQEMSNVSKLRNSDVKSEKIHINIFWIKMF